MVFSSLIFLFRFLPIVLFLYFITPSNFKNLVLFAISLIFYAWGEPIYIYLMIFSTLVDYINGRLVYYYKEQQNFNLAKFFVVLSIIINLCVLAFFKYADFSIHLINRIAHTNFPLLHLALPIGISFYTFQTMSYTIDIYRGNANVQKNIISFGTYVALFPQLIAGPIVQYKTIARQLNSRKTTIDNFSYGAARFMIGLGKKVLLANNIGLLFQQISVLPATELPTLTAWLGIIAFTFQLYFDFSGYSDMAIGLGSIFGFHFLENFNYPYEAKNITEFWRKWHISLGTWFKEYVYIPLGGNKKGILKQIRNISIVWFLTGLWHGASWNFVLWGVYFGIFLILEKTFLLKILTKIPVFMQRIYTLIIVIISWAIFCSSDILNASSYFKSMIGFGEAGLINQQTIYLFYNHITLFLLVIIGCTSFPKKLINKLISDKEMVKPILQTIWIFLLFFLCVAYLVNETYNPFLYFRF